MFSKKFVAFFISTRPKTIVVAATTFIIGTLCAYWDYGNPLYRGTHTFNFSWGKSALLLSIGVLLQIGANYTNDYFDCYLKKSDTLSRKGPLRAIHTGTITPRELFWGTCLIYLCALLLGWHLSNKTSLFIFFLTVMFGFLSFSYTGGISFAYRGWGGIAAFLIFGPLAVCTIYYTQLGYSVLSARIGFVLLNSISCGAFALALISVNNVRDVQEDKLCGKNTLEVQWGESIGRMQYKYSMLFAYAFVFISHVKYRIPYKIFLFWIPFIHCLYCIKNFESRNSKQLNLSLQETVINMCFFCGAALICWGVY